MDKQELIVPKIEGIKANWANLAEFYADHDSTAQTFYFSLLNILKVHQAKNILEVGCGRSTLLPHAIQLKNPKAHYLATDISPEMLALGDKFLREHFAMYHSQLSFEEWLAKNKVEIKVHNGEEPVEGEKFDRIICNMVLMLTEDPEKMLNTFNKEAEVGCLLGVTVWGKKELNKFHV